MYFSKSSYKTEFYKIEMLLFRSFSAIANSSSNVSQYSIEKYLFLQLDDSQNRRMQSTIFTRNRTSVEERFVKM